MGGIRQAILGGVIGVMVCSGAYAEKLTIAISGNNHASLFPSAYPQGRVGGVTRRNTLLRDIISTEKNSLILDTGDSFGGGKFDRAVQNNQSDKNRSVLFARSLALVKYDACAIGESEFNFGVDFLISTQRDLKIPYVAANLSLPGIRPYIIKDFGTFKVGIVALAPDGLGARYKIQEIPYEQALDTVLKEFKDKMVSIVVLLSNLSDEKNRKLLEKYPSIQLIAGGMFNPRENYYQKIGQSSLIKPFPFSEKIVRVDMRISNGNLQNVSFNQASVEASIKEHDQTKQMLPACFIHTDCPEKDGWIAQCAVTQKGASQCLYQEARTIPVAILTDTSYKAYKDDQLVQWLKKDLPGIKTVRIDYSSKKGRDLIRQYALKTLPAVVFDSAVEKEPFFLKQNKMFIKHKNKYLLDPAVSGVFLFLDRQKIDNTINLFLNLFDEHTPELILFFKNNRASKKVELSFLIIEKNDTFDALGGTPEVEEALRIVSVEALYPDKVWDYLEYRLSDVKSTWWDQAARKAGLDPARVADYAQSDKAKQSLRENIKQAEDLQILRGPVMLVDNIRIYSLQKGIGTELLKNIFQK